MIELTLQEYYELVQSEGLLTKSLGTDSMTMDDVGVERGKSLDAVKLLICTSDEDRYNDILDPNGIVLDNFKLNPLFLFEHAQKKSFSESILGRINAITTTEKGIIAEAQYVPLQTNPLPGQIWEMEKKGLIPGNSIGWRPLGAIRTHNGKRYVGKWELLEASKVLIPVNGRASNRQLAS